MKKLLLALLLALPFTMNAQTFSTEKDPQSDAVIIKGECLFEDLNSQPVFSWMQNAASYQPDAAAIAILKKHLPDHKLVVLFGSWCSDSQEQLPRLYKVLQAVDMPEEQVMLYGLDRSKKEPAGKTEVYHVERVPTIILLRDDKEIGRIVETPRESIEKDLAAMLSK